MFDDYELYQGVVLRQLVVGATSTIQVSPFRREGRINAFVVNEKVGVFVKHSSKRMSPWRFTFHVEHENDLSELEAAYPAYVAFVCGEDGIVTIDTATLHELVSFDDTEQAWVRIDRKPRSLYGLAGNRSEFRYKIPRGTAQIHAAIHAP
jgi:hypothetical protein